MRRAGSIFSEAEVNPSRSGNRTVIVTASERGRPPSQKWSRCCQMVSATSTRPQENRRCIAAVTGTVLVSPHGDLSVTQKVAVTLAQGFRLCLTDWCASICSSSARSYVGRNPYCSSTSSPCLPICARTLSIAAASFSASRSSSSRRARERRMSGTAAWTSQAP